MTVPIHTLRRALAELREPPSSSSPVLGGRVIGSAPALIYVYDVIEGRNLFQNRSLAQLLGYTGDTVPELAEEEWKRLVHPDDASRFPAYRERLAVLADGESASFEYRMRSADGEWRWLLSRDTAFQRDEDGRLRCIIGSTSDITEQKRTEEALRVHEQQLQLLIDELNHRVKNTLALVHALAVQTRTHVTTPDAFHDAFDGRLRTLAGAHDLLTREGWQGASLAEVLDRTTTPYLPAGSKRLTVNGPPVRLMPNVALALSMAFHELATNAVKYGALSAPTGVITVRWAWTAPAGATPRELDLEWQERGGPDVVPPTRMGLGARLLGRNLATELNGTVNVHYAPDGLACRLTIPFSERMFLS